MKTSFVGDENKNEKKRKASGPKGLRPGGVHIAGLKGGQRVKIIEALPAEALAETGTKSEAPHFARASRGLPERVRSKKYVSAKANIAPGKLYALKDAIKLVKETSYSKFDGTMELHLIVKKAGTSVAVTLPHAAGREKKIEIATDETIEKLKAGKIDFDILVATPEMMPKLVPFARLLGPKGLMPNPKNETLVTDPKKAKGFSAGTVTLKTEKEAPLIHTVVGKNSQEDKEIEENIAAVLKVLGGSKQIVRAFLKSTMSPSVKLQVA